MEKAKRDQEIEKLRHELMSLEWQIKSDEIIPLALREKLKDQNLDDVVLKQLTPYCRKMCERYERTRQQLRRMNR